MIELCALIPRRATLYTAELFKLAMVRFDRPDMSFWPLALIHSQRQVAPRPVFPITVGRVKSSRTLSASIHLRKWDWTAYIIQ